MVDVVVHLRSTVTSLLSSSLVQKIDFQLGVQRVNGAGFTAVKNAIDLRTQDASKGIGLVVTSTPGAGGQYSPTDNNIELPFWHAMDAHDRGTIVHECVHAMQDIRYPKGSNGAAIIASSETEAAAFVADALYYFYETGSYVKDDPITIYAAAIAEKIKSKSGAIVDHADVSVLRRLVASHPLYAGSLHRANWTDGVPGT